MKGHFLHNCMMADPLEAALHLKGYHTIRELAARPGQRPPSVDLACHANGRLILFEFERTTDRIAADLQKAKLMGGDLLIIVVPHASVRERVVATLHRLRTPGCPRVQVMTLGAVLQWVANNCTMLSQTGATATFASSPLNSTKETST